MFPVTANAKSSSSRRGDSANQRISGYICMFFYIKKNINHDAVRLLIENRSVCRRLSFCYMLVLSTVVSINMDWNIYAHAYIVELL